MKKVAWLIMLALLVFVAAAPQVQADTVVQVRGHHWSGHHHWRGHTGFRFYWSAPLVFAPWWYPYYGSPYPSAPVAPAPSPPVFKEPEPQPQDYWYYCRDPQGYYPYVQKCPGGWMKVVPETPAQQ